MDLLDKIICGDGLRMGGLEHGMEVLLAGVLRATAAFGTTGGYRRNHE